MEIYVVVIAEVDDYNDVVQFRAYQTGFLSEESAKKCIETLRSEYPYEANYSIYSVKVEEKE